MYRFIYDIDFRRTIPGVMIDARAGTPLANQIGSVIKAATDAAVNLVGSLTLPYKIETSMGNLVGIFTLNLDSTGQIATLGQFVLRPAFQQFISEIQTEITNFIQTGAFGKDYLQ